MVRSASSVGCVYIFSVAMALCPIARAVFTTLAPFAEFAIESAVCLRECRHNPFCCPVLVSLTSLSTPILSHSDLNPTSIADVCLILPLENTGYNRSFGLLSQRSLVCSCMYKTHSTHKSDIITKRDSLFLGTFV